MKKLNIGTPNSGLAVVINYGATAVITLLIVFALQSFGGQLQEVDFKLGKQLGIAVLSWLFAFNMKRNFADLIHRFNFAKDYTWFSFKTELIFTFVLLVLFVVFNTEGFGYLSGQI